MRFREALVSAVLGAAFVILAGAGPAAAQGGQANVVPVQGLQFGQLFPGIDMRIAPSDVGRRGEVQVDGRGRYQIQFILPTELTTADGATLPVTFGAADGVLIRGTAGAPESFDPNVGASVSLSGGVQDAQIFLGGTASPAQTQQSGVYTANITIVLARN